MSQVEFNEENSPSILYAKFQSSNEPPGMVKWLVTKGIAKDASQANMILLVTMVAAIILTAIIFYKFVIGGSSKITPQELQIMHSVHQNMPGIKR